MENNKLKKLIGRLIGGILNLVFFGMFIYLSCFKQNFGMTELKDLIFYATLYLSGCISMGVELVKDKLDEF